LLAAAPAQAQVSVSASAGTTGPSAYTTLKGAFDAINAGTHGGAVVVTLSGNTTENATASLGAPAGATPYTSVLVTTSAAATVSGNFAAALVSLNGARNVTIQGNNQLQLVNSSTSGYALRLQNDASNNVVRQTTLRGAFNGVTAGNLPSGGVVFFDFGITTGNDNNRIDSCAIDGTGTANCLVFSRGLTTSSTTFNSGNQINGCQLFDNANGINTASVGIFLSAANTDWTIRGNSLYHTAALQTTQQYIVRGILVVPTLTSDAHTVSGNFVGGNAAGASGTMTISGTGTNALGFIGIDVETGGTGNLVANNTVRNVTLTYAASAGSFGNAGIFGFIGGFNGTSTFSGNTVSNLNFSNTNGVLIFAGIHLNGQVTEASTNAAPVFTLSDNSVTANTANSGGTGDVNMFGIRLDASSAANLTSNAVSSPRYVVTGNTVSNINMAFGGTAASFIRGIGTLSIKGTGATAALRPRLDIRNNTIHSITSAAAVGSATANAQFGSGVATGIHVGGSNGVVDTFTRQTISQNEIYALSGTNTGDVNAVVIGILATNGVYEISRNRIYDLRNAAVGITNLPGIVGITLRAAVAGTNLGAHLIANNMVALGMNQPTNMPVYGILQNLNNPGTRVSVFHNTVMIGGAGQAGNTRATAAFLRGTETLGSTVTTTVDVRSNIFYNTRTGGGNHYALANTFTGDAGTWLSGTNNLFAGNASNLALWGTAAQGLNAYQASSGDATTRSVAVNFTNMGVGDLHLAGNSLLDNNLQVSNIGINVDFDGDIRGTVTTAIGADEQQQIATAVSQVNVDFAGSLLMPSIVRSNTTLRVHARRGSDILWLVTDAQGRALLRFRQVVAPGQNDLQLSLQSLGTGSYHLTGFPAKGDPIRLRFVKM